MSTLHATPTDRRTQGHGLLYTGGAFAVWGLAPLFWKQVIHVPAVELVAYRILSCMVLMALLLLLRRRLGGLATVLSSGRTVLTLLATTALIAVNWFLFVYAILSEQVLQASLGYYVNPLLSVLLGMVVLGERLRPAQWLSVALAVVGVSVLAWRVGTMPWLALSLAVSFALYGLLRKTVAAPPEEGLLVETALLTPAVLGYFFWLAGGPGLAVASGGIGEALWLAVGTGAITALPLVWFTHGARRLPLSTVGLLQYIAPTGQFLLAVLVFGEPLAPAQLLTFVCIWTALAIFTWDLRQDWRRRHRQVERVSR